MHVIDSNNEADDIISNVVENKDYIAHKAKISKHKNNMLKPNFVPDCEQIRTTGLEISGQDIVATALLANIGGRVKRFWPDNNTFDPETAQSIMNKQQPIINYYDGEQQTLNMDKEMR